MKKMFLWNAVWDFADLVSIFYLVKSGFGYIIMDFSKKIKSS